MQRYKMVFTARGIRMRAYTGFVHGNQPIHARHTALLYFHGHFKVVRIYTSPIVGAKRLVRMQ